MATDDIVNVIFTSESIYEVMTIDHKGLVRKIKLLPFEMFRLVYMLTTPGTTKYVTMGNEFVGFRLVNGENTLNLPLTHVEYFAICYLFESAHKEIHFQDLRGEQGENAV